MEPNITIGQPVRKEAGCERARTKHENIGTTKNPCQLLINSNPDARGEPTGEAAALHAGSRLPEGEDLAGPGLAGGPGTTSHQRGKLVDR